MMIKQQKDSIILSKSEYESKYGFRLQTPPGSIYDAIKDGGISQERFTELMKDFAIEWTIHRKLLWSFFATRRLIFLGFSLDDPYFNKMLEFVKTDLHPHGYSIHYLILRVITEADKTRAKARSAYLKKNFGIETILYQENKSNKLDEGDEEVTKMLIGFSSSPAIFLSGEPWITAFSKSASGSLGVSARNFLGWILAKRKTELKPYIDRLGAGRGVELVCKTYSSDLNASRKLLELIFEMLKEPDYEIYYFMNLCEYVKDILEYDPKFVGEVYLTIFRHEETSTEETLMGSSVIMNFRSNRRQDFEMCYFRLVQFFPTFLNASAEKAIPVGLAVVNLAILKDRATFISEFAEIPFDINGKKCVYIPDNASLWSDRLNF